MGRNNPTPSKTPRHKQAYVKAIREQEYQPTVDEGFKFYESDNLEESPEIEDVPRRRPISFRERMSDLWDAHGANTTIGLLVVGLVAFLGYFLIDSNKSLVKIETKLENNTKALDEVKADVKKTSEDVTKLQMETRENKLKIEFNKQLIETKK